MKLRYWTKEETNFLKKNYQEMTLREIGVKIGRTVQAVGCKCHRLGLKKRQKIVVNKEPTPDLAYVLGVCYGDGSVYKRKNKPTYLVTLKVMDRVFAVSFRNALENIGLRPCKIFHSKRGRWQVQAAGKDFYEWYHALNYEGIFNILTTKEMKKEFIRGFYESDGSFYRKGSNWKVMICNTNFKLLKLIEKIVSYLGFKTKIYEETKRNHGKYLKPYKLYLLGGCREVIRFLQAINPRIPRKSLKKVDFSDRRGLARPMWNKEEEEFMRKKYPKKKIAVEKIGRILNRSENAIRAKAYQMGLNRNDY